MEQSDVAQTDAPAPAEPTAEELQAEIDVLKSEVEQQAAQTAPAPVEIQARQPSSASPTQAPESAPEVDEAALPLEDAVRALLVYVKGRRVVGDSDLDAAIADVEAALSAA